MLIKKLFFFFFLLLFLVFSSFSRNTRASDITLEVVCIEMEAFHRGIQSDIALIGYLRQLKQIVNPDKMTNEEDPPPKNCEPYWMFINAIYEHQKHNSLIKPWEARIWVPKNGKGEPIDPSHIQGPHDVEVDKGVEAKKPREESSNIYQYIWGEINDKPPVITYSCVLYIDPTLRKDVCLQCHKSAEATRWHITYMTKNCNCLYCENTDNMEKPPVPDDKEE